jgi:hypothetical protein
MNPALPADFNQQSCDISQTRDIELLYGMIEVT